MNVYNVLLEDGTCGTHTTTNAPETLVGMTVTVRLHDENGMPIKVTGKVIKVL